MLRISLTPDVADPRMSQKAANFSGAFPRPPYHRSPSPEGWLRTVNQIPVILLDQDDSDVNLGEHRVFYRIYS
jgi:hypothetical protein